MRKPSEIKVEVDYSRRRFNTAVWPPVVSSAVLAPALAFEILERTLITPEKLQLPASEKQDEIGLLPYMGSALLSAWAGHKLGSLFLKANEQDTRRMCGVMAASIICAGFLEPFAEKKKVGQIANAAFMGGALGVLSGQLYRYKGRISKASENLGSREDRISRRAFFARARSDLG